MTLIDKLFIKKKRKAADSAAAAETPNLEKRTIDIPSLTPKPIRLTGKIEERVINGVTRKADSRVVSSNAVIR